MVRTKDLFLFVLILLFLFIGIGATLSFSKGSAPAADQQAFVDTHDTEDFVGVYEEVTPNRAGLVERLRDLIDDDVVFMDDDSTSNSDNLALATNTPGVSEDSSVAAVQYCASGVGDDMRALEGWPREGVRLSVEDGTRLLTGLVEVAVPVSVLNASGTPTGSTTFETDTEIQALATLSRAPLFAATPACLASEIIGVTTDGRLLFNTDTAAYRQWGAEVLIGYARDGFPIYGSYDGAVDQCGGYNSPRGYRYTLSQTSPTFLQCYTATPVQFYGE